jgi:hypothetical protein
MKNTNSTLMLPARSALARVASGTNVGFADGIERESIDLESLGFLFPIEGGAKGAHTLGDVLTQTIDGRDLNAIWAEFQAVLALHNAKYQTLIDLLSFRVTQPIEDVAQVTSEDFEEASEFGVPKGIRGGDFFSLGYDFKWYDLAVRYTWMFLSEATAGQVESAHNMALEADKRLIFTKVMKAIFNNVNRTATIRGSAVNVYPFYNADGTVPPEYNGNTFTGSENHYMVSGGATVVSGDLDDMDTKLRLKGYGANNGAQQILLANTAQLTVIKTFRIASGDSNDFIPSVNTAPFLVPVNTGGIVGAQPPSSFRGMTVAGQYGNWLVIEEDRVPAGYLLGFATGGEQNASNPVGIREHSRSSLRGLLQIGGKSDGDYPIIDSFYQRGFGTGVRHRGAGVVMQIKASGSYDIPAAYA